MATEALECALSDMEVARGAFNACAARVSAEIGKQQERVTDWNAITWRDRQHAAQATVMRKHRRLSGDAAAHSGAHANPDTQTEVSFIQTVRDAEGHVQSATCAMARVHAATQSVHASVDAAKASATIWLANASQARNECCSELIRLMQRTDLGGKNHAMILSHLGVVNLWRARSISRSFRRWCTSSLRSMPMLVAIGGCINPAPPIHAVAPHKVIATPSVESLDLSTLYWSQAGEMPALPNPRFGHSVSAGVDGRVVVCCGYNHGCADEMNYLRRTTLQWLPGAESWSELPGLPHGRVAAATVRLPDGRTMLIGGMRNGQALASVLVLAIDGSKWMEHPPLLTARAYLDATLLPNGKVLVVGGKTDPTDPTSAVASIEMWDPVRQLWAVFPPMVCARFDCAVCVLSSGRVAVLGGCGSNGRPRKDGELYDPVKQRWKPLPPMAHIHANICAAPISGGAIVLGMAEKESELYDEASGRWYKLPCEMLQRRQGARLASVPAFALLGATPH
jgi:hypothetical protein